MSKTLNATCVGGVVTSGGVPVSEAEIFSEGVGASEGLLIQDQDKAFYIAKTTEDLKTTLEKVISALTDLTTALTLIDAKPTGAPGSSVTPVAAASIVNITAATAELTALSGLLK